MVGERGWRRRRQLLLVAALAALVTFAIVQDRGTAAGARRYAAQARQAAAAGQTLDASVDEVMAPAIADSVRRAAFWGGVVLVGGVALVFAIGRR